MERLEYNNIFDAITDDSGEAAELQFRSDLMIVMRKIFEAKGWTQKDITVALGIPQPRASELCRGKIDKFSSDKLIGFLAKLGFTFKPTYDQSGADALPVHCEVRAA
ncbi:MAG TPA: hypothetical protein DIW43_14455 [Spongiibacteraceae bacterium]|nr:hypothetical protein [Spongiibacteraceae bacterium]HCS28660.1 hypothetical protein [Spongiibacteraceae bacterium]